MAQVQCGDDNGGFLSTKRLLLFHGQLRNEIVCKEMQLRLLGGGGGGERGKVGRGGFGKPFSRSLCTSYPICKCAFLALGLCLIDALCPGYILGGLHAQIYTVSNNSEK